MARKRKDNVVILRILLFLAISLVPPVIIMLEVLFRIVSR